MVNSRGYGKFEVWIDDPILSLYIYSEYMCTTKLVDGKIEIDFGDGWKEFLSEGGIEGFIEDANNKI